MLQKALLITYPPLGKSSLADHVRAGCGIAGALQAAEKLDE
jgi:hypothetical protein